MQVKEEQTTSSEGRSGESQPTGILACPLCRQRLETLPNGRAVCRNLVHDADSVEDFEARSCPMAAYGVQLAVTIWQQLNTREDTAALRQRIVELEAERDAVLAHVEKIVCG